MGWLIIISADAEVQIASLRPGNINLRGHFIGIYWNGKNQVMWSKSHQRLQGDLELRNIICRCAIGSGGEDLRDLK